MDQKGYELQESGGVRIWLAPEIYYDGNADISFSKFLWRKNIWLRGFRVRQVCRVRPGTDAAQ